MKKSYYIDSNIYLNLWKKEVDPKTGLKFWKIARDFLQKIEINDNIVYYSGFILKELSYILSKQKYEEKRKLFYSTSNFVKEVLTNVEYEEARRIEAQLKNEISFYDIIHLLISKKTNSILITRDNKLLEVSNKLGLEAKKPEELL